MKSKLLNIIQIKTVEIQIPFVYIDKTNKLRRQGKTAHRPNKNQDLIKKSHSLDGYKFYTATSREINQENHAKGEHGHHILCFHYLLQSSSQKYTSEKLRC